MTILTRIRILVFALAFASASAAAMAQNANISLGTTSFDSNQPVEVSADSLSVDQGTGQATFDGNVLVVQGDVRMTAARIIVIYAKDEDGNASGIDQLLADGGVTFVTATDAAEAREAVYSVGDGQVTLSGEVLLTQGVNAIAGDKLVLDLESGNGQIEGRVRTVFGTGDGN